MDPQDSPDSVSTSRIWSSSEQFLGSGTVGHIRLKQKKNLIKRLEIDSYRKKINLQSLNQNSKIVQVQDPVKSTSRAKTDLSDIAIYLNSHIFQITRKKLFSNMKKCIKNSFISSTFGFLIFPQLKSKQLLIIVI